MNNSNLYMVRIKTVREKKIQYCGECITSSEKACDIVRPIIGDSDKEVVITMCLDAKLRPLTIERTAIGTTDQCMVLPKEILKTAILSNARGIMIFHNHPSGNIEPSRQDRLMTKGMYGLFDRLAEQENLYSDCTRSEFAIIRRYHCQAVIGILREWSIRDTENLDGIVHTVYRLLRGDIRP